MATDLIDETAIEDERGKAALEEAHKRLGNTLRSKWRLERLIGIGGMGAVYEARHRNGMRGAVKVLDAAMSRTKDCRERFLREGRLANEVGHVGAVRVLDDDETEDGSAFLVMELLAGKTLDQVALDRGGTLSAEDTLRYAAQVLDTIACAHARGVIHRDIKPENLLLTNEGVVKILDFGIARWNALGESQRVTQAGEPIGTPAFMPPEQARGHWRAVDVQSDVYSLGATMFSLATAEPIHPDATTVAELLVAVITRPARPVRHAGDVPEALARVIDKALSYDKRGRFATAAEMRKAVEAAHVELTGNPIPATPAPAASGDATMSITSAKSLRARLATTVARHRGRAPMLLAFGAPCVVLIAAALGVSMTSRTQAAEAPAALVESARLKTAPTMDIPPPPPVEPDEVQEVHEVRVTANATHARAAFVAPVTRVEEPLRVGNVSHLSRRSTLYERRF